MNVDVAKNLHEVLGNLPKDVRLVAISKYHPCEYIEAAYAEGQRIFGESHEQELKLKVEKLLKEINKHAAKHNRIIKVLLELHIAEEETKYGLTPDACRELLAEGEWRTLDHVQICGLMMMASNTDNQDQIASEFETAARFFDEIKTHYFADSDAFKDRSWGMSHDYKTAICHGSTMVRVGTTIFGPRVY